MKISLKKPDGSCCCGSRYHIVGGCLCRDPCDTENTEELEPCSVENPDPVSAGNLYVYEKSQIPTGCCGSEAVRPVILDAGGFPTEGAAFAELNANYDQYRRQLCTTCDHLEVTVEYGTGFYTTIPSYTGYPLPYSPGDFNYTFNRRIPRGTETIYMQRVGRDRFEFYEYKEGEGVASASYLVPDDYIHIQVVSDLSVPQEWLDWIQTDGTSFTCPEGYEIDPSNPEYAVRIPSPIRGSYDHWARAVSSWPYDCEHVSPEFKFEALLPCSGTVMSPVAAEFYSTSTWDSAAVGAWLALDLDWYEQHGPCASFMSPPMEEGLNRTPYMYDSWFLIWIHQYVYGTVRYVRNEV